MKPLKTFFVCLILCSLTTLGHCQADLQKVRISDYIGGMNSKSLADIIAPNTGTMVSNAVINSQGRIFKRDGLKLFASVPSADYFPGIGRFDPDINTSYIMAASGTHILQATATASGWASVNNASPLTAGFDIDFIQANELLFILNGYDNPEVYTGANAFVVGTYPTSPPVATTATWLRNYLFTAGKPGFEDWIFISNNLNPLKFDASDIIKINTGDGQPIRKIEAFRENEVIIYKSRSIYVLDITGSTLSSWTLQPITTAIGCIAPRSVVNLGNDQWFLSSNPIAVRSLARTQFNTIFIESESDQIQDIFDGTGSLQINKERISKAAGVLFDNKYFLAIPTGDSTVNNTVLVYDFIVKNWSIITGWHVYDWIVFNEKLYFADSSDGRVFQAFGSNVGDYPKGHVNGLDYASSPTSAIFFQYVSRTIDFDQPENFKQLDSIETEFEGTGNYTATVSINLDNGGWQTAGTVNLTGSGPALAQTLPFSMTGNGIAKKTFQLTQYGEFRKIQVRVEENGLNEQVKLQRITIFARVKPWRREN